MRKLLNQIYGFKRNQHGEGRETWDWIHNNVKLVESVATWRNLPDGSFDAKKIAGNLGLDSEDFGKAVAGGYARPCLLLVLFIYQVHRHLDILDAWVRGHLIHNSTSFLKAIGNNSFGPDCRALIRKQETKINDITHYSDTEALGRELRKLLSELGS